MNFTLNLKQWTIIALGILAAIAGYSYGYVNIIGQIIIAILVCSTLSTLIDFIRTKKLLLSESSIITGLIIAIVVAPNTSLISISIISIIAILSKYLIKFNKKTIFNPAALSLLIGTIFLKTPLSWWGDNNHIFTIIIGAILLIKYNGHWKMIFAFILTLIGLITVQSLVTHQPIVDQLYFNLGISFFFAFFMLTDPRTSPILSDQFINFGIVTATGSFLFSIFYPPATLIGGLLIANLATLYLNKLSLDKIKAKNTIIPKPVTT